MSLGQSVREQFIEWAREKGLTRFFGNPGSTELTMFRDFPEDFGYVMALHEGCAVAMADGYAQARRAPALVNLHSAAGVGNAMGTIFTAFRNGTPLIITAGQQARSILLHDPFLHSDRAAELLRPHIKYAIEPARAQDVPAAIAKAWQIAMTAPMGPVFVSIPADDWDQPAEPWSGRPAPLSAAAGDVTALAEALAGSANPVIVAGGEVDRSGAWEALVALAEASGAPVWHAPLEGRIGFPQSHPHFAGILPADPVGIRETFTGHDLILVVGTRAFTYHIEGPKPFAPGAPLFQISESAEMLAAAVCGQGILGDIRRTLEALLATLGNDPANRSSRAQSRDLGALPDPSTSLGTNGGGDGLVREGPITLPYLLHTLNRLRDPASAIVEEAPTARGDLPVYLPIDRPDQFFTCASGGLGFGLAASVGVAMARPDVRTIALIGDGSAMYGIQSLHAAAREKSNLLALVFNNGRYAALDGFASKFQLHTTVGCDLAGLDFVKLAEAQGVAAERVETAEALEAVLARGLAAAGPMLVEVMLP